MVPRRCGACASIGVRFTENETGMAMRNTEAGVWMLQDPLRRGLRLAVVVLSVAVVMTVGAARAQDDDDEDDKTFEEKIIGNIMAGIGGTNMESRGIEYRERSPLVVPPRLDLPPPEFGEGRNQGSELAEGPGREAPEGCDRGPQEGRSQEPDRSRPAADSR